jgi:hypothetical protein
MTKEVGMVTFPQAVAQAMKFVEARQSELWLDRLDVALERRGIDCVRRERWMSALKPFLARHALRPELLRPGQVQDYIEEQAESGRYSARVLIDLIQALSFFYDSVVEHRELAGEAGHPFDLPAEDWAVATVVETVGGKSGPTARIPNPTGIKSDRIRLDPEIPNPHPAPWQRPDSRTLWYSLG